MGEAEAAHRDLEWLVTAGSADATLVLDEQFRAIAAIQHQPDGPDELEHSGFGRDTLGEVHPDDLPAALERLERLVDRPGATDFMEVRVLRPSGEWLDVLFVASNRFDDDGVGGIVLRVHVLADLSTEVDSRNAAAGAAVADRQPIADVAPCGIDVRDRSGTVSYTNRWLRQRFAPGGGLADWTDHAADHDTCRQIIDRGLAGESVAEDVWLTLEGVSSCFRVRVEPNRSTDGAITGLVTTLIDITAEVAGRVGLERSERRLTSTLDSLAQGVIIFASTGDITYANDAVHEHMGVPHGSLVGSPLPQLVLDRLTVTDDLLESADQTPPELEQGQPASVTGRIVHYAHPDGSKRWTSLSTAEIPGGEGEFDSVVLIIDDITDRHEQTRLLAHQALHDSLTGLPNRSAMLEFLVGALARQERRGERVCGVLFCDLDGFKEVNDTLGHHSGDEVLLTVAHRIHKSCRAADRVGRLGGDEFIVVLEALNHPTETDTVANRIIDAVAEPIYIGEDEVTLGISIGVAVSDGSEDAEDLLSRADAALYEAKGSGKGTWRTHGGVESDDG